MAIGLLVLTSMALLGFYSLLAGRFIIPAVFFLLFIAGCAFIIVYCTIAEVYLSGEGIFQKTLFGLERFRWAEIENWAVRTCLNNNDELLFKVGSPDRKVQISGAAVNAKEMLEVKVWFQEFVGDAMRYDAFMAQFEKSNQ